MGAEFLIFQKMTDIPEIDENLWFLTKTHCEGKHFLLGNPHTFCGRFLAWCPNKEISFSVSKVEIEKLSTQSEYWIKGFLSGNEPQPPTDENNDVDFESVEYKNWLKQIEEFKKTGIW